MHIFLLFQLKSTMIIRYFLFAFWNLVCNLESCPSKHSSTHLACLFTIELGDLNPALLNWTLLGNLHVWFISQVI